MKKDLRDIKTEYGKVLRWWNGGGDESGNTWPYRFFLEDTITGEREEITDQAALDLIRKKTTNAFRNSVDLYDNYVELFQALGLEKKPGSARMSASARYDAKATKQVSLKLNLKTDADILDALEKSGNIQGYIKELIRKDLEDKKKTGN